MTKSKKHPKLRDLPPGEIYFLDDPKPIGDIKNIALAGCDLLEAKYQDAIESFDRMLWEGTGTCRCLRWQCDQRVRGRYIGPSVSTRLGYTIMSVAEAL